MNKPSVFILLLTILSFSLMQCDNGDKADKSNNPYTGEWELLSITGGIAGNGYPADFSLLFLGNDASYWIGSSTNKVAQGTYQLFKKGEEDWIKFDTQGDPNHLHNFESQEKMIGFSIEGTLFMAEPCCDLFSYEFKKLKEDDR